MHYVIVILAAFLAGVINSVAGGGTLLTFPSLLAAGILPVAANATSTVALVPASVSAWWGYREEQGGGGWKELAWLSAPSLIGGLAGALLVLKAGDSLFSRLVPWLILGATALFIVQEPLRRWMTSRRLEAEERPAWPLIAVFQLIVAVYGGFFGAGIGIMMLASLGLAGLSNIHHMNRLKNFAAVCINGVAAVTFIASHRVDWPFVWVMLAGSIPGGYAGAWVARKVGQVVVRRFVIGVGLAIGVYMLIKQATG